jgi:hypothetical protein
MVESTISIDLSPRGRLSNDTNSPLLGMSEVQDAICDLAEPLSESLSHRRCGPRIPGRVHPLLLVCERGKPLEGNGSVGLRSVQARL